MNTVAFVSCVKTKVSDPSTAEFLYCSPWFKQARKYAKRVAQHWYILSAKYGLVLPDQTIEPYEARLSRRRGARAEWARGVIESIQEQQIANPGDRVVWLAGKDYRDLLIAGLPDCEHVVPMHGMKLGPQLSWLKSQNNQTRPPA